MPFSIINCCLSVSMQGQAKVHKAACTMFDGPYGVLGVPCGRPSPFFTHICIAAVLHILIDQLYHPLFCMSSHVRAQSWESRP